VADNVDRRPVYVISDTRHSSALPWIQDLDRTFYRISRSNFLTWELSRNPPASAEASDIRALAHPVDFRDAVGTLVAQLSAYDARLVHGDGAEWLRVRVRWRFPAGRASPRMAALLRFADGGGRVWKEQSALDLPTARRIADMAGPRRLPESGEWSESFDLLAPPGMQLWLAASKGDELLKSGGQSYVSLGPLPNAAEPRMATDSAR
jgi:hypothetical protein